MTDEVFDGGLIDDAWLTLEQLAGACEVEEGWLHYHIEQELFPEAQSVAGVWRFSGACLVRARRMRRLERDFEAAPELAALFADLLEDRDRLRARLLAAGRPG
jgi:chaperone modulatory protein CbpM